MRQGVLLKNPTPHDLPQDGGRLSPRVPGKEAAVASSTGKGSASGCRPPWAGPLHQQERSESVQMFVGNL